MCLLCDACVVRVVYVVCRCFAVCCLSFGGGGRLSLSVVCCWLLFAACNALLAVRCLLVDVRCVSFVARRLLFAVCDLLVGACCVLFAVW